MADISFADTNYGLNEAAARRRYNQQYAGLQTQLGDLGERTQRALVDTTKAYQRAAPQQITSFTGRGLGRSGLFKQSMSDFAERQQQDLAGIARSQQDEQTRIALQEQQYKIALQDEIDRLRLQREGQIMADAAALKDLAPMTGLFS
jgi:hypothetical protein